MNKYIYDKRNSKHTTYSQNNTNIETYNHVMHRGREISMIVREGEV